MVQTNWKSCWQSQRFTPTVSSLLVRVCFNLFLETRQNCCWCFPSSVMAWGWKGTAILTEVHTFQVMWSRRRVTNMSSGWRAPLRLHFCSLRKTSPHVVPLTFWGLSRIPSQQQSCRWECAGKTRHYSEDSRANLILCQRKESQEDRPDSGCRRRFTGGGCSRMERLRGLEWTEVGGVMPASPQGLLSDRNMAASADRLRLGHIPGWGGPLLGAGEICPAEVSLNTMPDAPRCHCQGQSFCCFDPWVARNNWWVLV